MGSKMQLLRAKQTAVPRYQSQSKHMHKQPSQGTIFDGVGPCLAIIASLHDWQWGEVEDEETAPV